MTKDLANWSLLEEAESEDELSDQAESIKESASGAKVPSS